MRSLIMVIFLVLSASAQIPNAGFEQWTAGLPDSCWTNNSVVTPVTKSTTAYQGSAALKGEVVSYLNVPYTPQIIIGSVQGFATTARPGSMQFYYQFSPQGGDKFEGSVTLRKNNPLKIIAAGSDISIATATSGYTVLNVPFEYFYPDAPDVCVAQFLISNKDGEHVGSYFLLDAFSFSGTTVGVSSSDASLPVSFEADQNYPNPFNPSTTIRYGLPVNSTVSLTVYDLLGREVAQLVKAEQPAGWHVTTWNAGVSAGVYFYRLVAVSTAGPFRSFVQLKKMILLQ